MGMKGLDQIIIKREKQIPQAMYKPQSNLEKLRSSQRFLSREEPGARKFTLCCCEEADMEEEDLLAPAFSQSPHPKISIKKLRRQSPHGCNHTNSDFSLSKQSQRSNLPASKKTTQTHIPACPHCHHDLAYKPHETNKPLVPTLPASVTFLYSNPPPPDKSNHYNVKTHVTPSPPQAAPTRFPQELAKPKQLEDSIEKEFNTILDFGDHVKEEYTYGQAFPLEPDPPKIKAAQGMPNFSFGQNQKEKFMSKYLGVRQEGAGGSSKENSKRSQMMREIIQQRMSKSSKSSGRVFVRGTFNRQSQNLTTMGHRRNFMYKSQSQVSLESSQSLVLETYQSIMRKRESFIRDYQY